MTQTDMNSQNGDEFHGGFHTMGSVSVKNHRVNQHKLVTVRQDLG